MENCKHFVSFVEINRSKTINGVEIFWIEIRAVCPSCLMTLENEEIKIALLNMYIPKVADLVYKTFMHKTGFYVSVHDLNRMGLTYLPIQK